MGILSKWVDENTTLKDGANKAEFEELERKSTFEGITTKEQASDFMRKNAAFTAALDYENEKAVRTHDEKFMSEKFPDLIKAEREKIEAELNPQKTPEQKRIEELEKRLAADEEEKKLAKIAEKLVAKAKELGHPNPEQAKRYVAYGENAESELKSDIEYINGAVNTSVEAKIKERYGNQQAPRGSSSAPETTKESLITKYNEIEKSNDPDRGAKMLALKEQIAKFKE